jgi:GT2 family glycosyltransferase
VPVIRGGWLIQCIDSVLQQSSPNWTLSLLWDQGDPLSAELLDQLIACRHPRIRVYRAESRLGIARARQYLTERSQGGLILPLDDDDVLETDAVSRFLCTAVERPWAGIVRARRRFIDDKGEPVLMNDWFPFERRRYFDGATVDVSNHSHPYAIRRSVLEAAGGWLGQPDFQYAGEDCECFLRVEEHADVELLDEVLYQYRLHGDRTSLRVDDADVHQLWARMADHAIERRQLDVVRTNDRPPFHYDRVRRSVRAEDVEFVIPFFETNEQEIEYAAARPAAFSELFDLQVDSYWRQNFDPPLPSFDHIEIALGAYGPVRGRLCAAFYAKSDDPIPILEVAHDLEYTRPVEFDFVRLGTGDGAAPAAGFSRCELRFTAEGASLKGIFLLIHEQDGDHRAMLRLFRSEPGFSKSRLRLCLAGLEAAGVPDDAIHIVECRQSSAANRNEGFRRTTSSWVCFLDDDAEISEGTLSGMLQAAKAHDAKLCGPKLLTPRGRVYSGIPFADPLTMEMRLSGMGAADDGSFDVTEEVPWLPSTVLMVHRSVMLATGGFDESYLGSQHEDVDFSLRARARGFKCLYVGAAAATHHNLLRNGQLARNMEYLKMRWSQRQDLFQWP